MHSLIGERREREREREGGGGERERERDGRSSTRFPHAKDYALLRELTIERSQVCFTSISVFSSSLS